MVGPPLTPSPSPAPTPFPVGNGSLADFALSGNVTNSQIANITIATNQSANTTILSFTVTGQSGNTGFSNITIPKDKVPYGETPTVYIDNKLCQNQSYTQDANNYYVCYTIHFSTHQIAINFISDNGMPTPTISPDQTSQQVNWLQIIIGVAAALTIATIVVVVLKLVVSKQQKLPCLEIIPVVAFGCFNVV